MAEAKKGKTGGAKKKASPAAKAKKKSTAKGGQSAKGGAGKVAKRPAKVAESKVAAMKRNIRDQDLDDSDELPPDDVVEGEAAALDAETLASEVERAEAKVPPLRREKIAPARESVGRLLKDPESSTVAGFLRRLRTEREERERAWRRGRRLA